MACGCGVSEVMLRQKLTWVEGRAVCGGRGRGKIPLWANKREAVGNQGKTQTTKGSDCQVWDLGPHVVDTVLRRTPRTVHDRAEESGWVGGV